MPRHGEKVRLPVERVLLIESLSVFERAKSGTVPDAFRSLLA